MEPDIHKVTLVHELFNLQQAKIPEHIAIRFEEMEISYRELHERSDNLAAQLLAVSPDSKLAGISATRGIEMIIGVLAILKAGKAYLPLDLHYPQERILGIISDSGIDACLASGAEGRLIEALGIKHLDSGGMYHNQSFSPATDSSLAYVLYTSGSTGKPKGVCMGHAPLVNLLQWQKRNSTSAEGFNTLQFSPLGFDVSFQEIFASLCTGGTLVLINESMRQDPVSLLRLMDKQGIHRIFLPFVALQFLTESADAEAIFPQTLREVITAGEQLKITPQVIRFFEALPECKLYNQYGPTECHVVTALKLQGSPRDWPALPSIGIPIDSVEILMLDEQLRLLENGQTGELCIAGACLAEGYLNRPELTTEKFITWQHPSKGQIRIYRTGDLACFMPDGNISFLGRKDDQVKIRGHRVEPGEIEVLLNHIDGIRQAVVVAADDPLGGKRLLAYLISQDSEQDTLKIRKRIATQLPDYMIPSAFIWLDQFPKTSSGKVDKKMLPVPDSFETLSSAVYKAPVTVTEKQVAAIWESLLQVSRIGVDDDFFELGGNSLLALKTVAVLKKEHNYELPVTTLYQFLTIKRIALFLEGGSRKLSLPFNNRRKQKNRAVAIIGMAGRFPGANTITEFWDILKDGRETTHFFTAEELDASIPEAIKGSSAYVKARGIIDCPGYFDAAFFGITPSHAEAMDPQQRIFLELAWEVLESTGHLPVHYGGAIGVFAGCGNNTYYLNNVLGNSELMDRVGNFQAMVLNEKDYISTRTAYQLNLKGPAISIHTACSTSLLAITQAVENIRNGSCDVAIAGGVAITSPVNSGQSYQEGSIFSIDGHTRSFDAQATGTVFSDGAGLILLKDVDSALADGDTIYALIKGVGYNNDGANKGSFTAPSALGQAGAIRIAIQDAGINSNDISYIEAHGTATPIGDPIEIEGLKMAFGETEAKQFCAIGSVKSNMGHLTAAAGVAGLIKTVLALQHRQIPPSINFNSANAAIDFESSPFFVNTTLKPWLSDKKRIAGISSFGVGGTNVHLILEEFEQESIPLVTEKQFHVLAWSAKTATSLNAYTGKLLNFTESEKEFNLKDTAYALHTTRMDFAHRRFVIASSVDEFAAQLTQAPLPSQQIQLKEAMDEVAFVFPGQGSQFPGMGNELYQREKVFRDAVDECALILKELTGNDIRSILFHADAASAELHHTSYTQPALFTIEYALAKLWLSWGIQPSALVGHSIGEFVAAHYAGVFSLKDALALVSVRGKLIGDLPGGNMLSVRLSAEKLEILLPSDLSIAVMNSQELCVVSGPAESIQLFSDILLEKNIPCRALNTSHAFHSAMMDQAVEPMLEKVKSVSLHPPRIPLVSTVSGTWMSEATATSPVYWAEQLRKPVLFYQAVNVLTEDRSRILLEVGPGNTAFQVMRQTLSCKNSVPVAGFKKEDEHSSMLRALGQLWLNGIQIDWRLHYPDKKGRKTILPSYAFDRQLYWAKASLIKENSAGSNVEGYNQSNEKNGYISPQLPNMRKEKLLSQIKSVLTNASGFDLEGADIQLNFIELGFDSLLLTMVATKLKKEFNVPVSFRQLNEEYNSPNKLADYLDAVLPQEIAQNREVMPAVPATQVSANSNLDQITQQLHLLARQVAEMQEKKLNTVQISPQENSELKKPFGATARIEKQAISLSDTQKTFLRDLTHRYTQKTKESKAHTAKHRDYMADPRVVSGFKPSTKELVYPIVANRSKGSRIWDIDGNEYIDALNGFGSNFLGYQHEVIKEAVLKQVEAGYEVGPQHPLAGEVCKLICEFTSSDRAALCNTGSEAVLGAMRIARTVTGRSIIVSFNGSYHGINDEVIVRGASNYKPFPAAPGIMPEAVQNMLVLDYGTAESLEVIRSRAEDIAAVLVEPVQSRRPDFVPVEFLKELRKITEVSGTVLVFDEVITGFRMHPGGAQALFGIKADLGTYGKVVAAGIPIGIIAGKKEFMDALDGGTWQFGDDSTPEAGVTYFAGTFVRHPLALAAAKASLDYMKAKGPLLQEGISAKVKRLADSMGAICKSKGLPIHIPYFGSLWKIKFTEDIPFSELVFTLMREKGIHIQDIFPCFLTEAHSESEVDAIINAFNESINELIKAGFLKTSGESALPSGFSLPDQPPLPGAKLGRDPEGNPAWFIQDPEKPGRYIQIST